jgi:hypothetical protein
LNATARRNSDDHGSIAVLAAFTSAQLDLALGRSNVVHAALLAGPESKAVLTRLARLERFRTGAVAATQKTAKTAKKPEKWERNG